MVGLQKFELTGTSDRIYIIHTGYPILKNLNSRLVSLVISNMCTGKQTMNSVNLNVLPVVVTIVAANIDSLLATVTTTAVNLCLGFLCVRNRVGKARYEESKISEASFVMVEIPFIKTIITQLPRNCSEVPLIKAVNRGVRVIELDLWPKSATLRSAAVHVADVLFMGDDLFWAIHGSGTYYNVEREPLALCSFSKLGGLGNIFGVLSKPTEGLHHTIEPTKTDSSGLVMTDKLKKIFLGCLYLVCNHLIEINLHAHVFVKSLYSVITTDKSIVGVLTIIALMVKGTVAVTIFDRHSYRLTFPWVGVVNPRHATYVHVVELLKDVRAELCEMVPQTWKPDIIEAITVVILSPLLKSGCLDMESLGNISVLQDNKIKVVGCDWAVRLLVASSSFDEPFTGSFHDLFNRLVHVYKQNSAYTFYLAVESLVRAAAAAYNHMTSNFGQLFYSGVTEANELSITQMIAELRGKMMQLIYTRRVEAGHDFVDILFSFMRLPVGIMVRLLEGHADTKFEALWGLNNVYKSVVDIPACYVSNEKYTTADTTIFAINLYLFPSGTSPFSVAYNNFGGRDTSSLASFDHGIHLHAKAVQPDYAPSVSAVVFTANDLTTAIEFNHYCRNHQPYIPLIKAGINGLFGNVFCDFGPEFTVADVDGFAYGTRAVLSHMATMFGGIATQEVIKACSGMFHPIFQLLYFVSIESLPKSDLPHYIDNNGISELRTILFKGGGDDTDMGTEMGHACRLAATHNILNATQCYSLVCMVQGCSLTATQCGLDATQCSVVKYMVHVCGLSATHSNLDVTQSQCSLAKCACLGSRLIGMMQELVALKRY